MPKQIFLTFSTSDWVGTRTRLYFRALECGWFDEVITADETIVPEEYRGRLDEPFHGYYFWKPIAIYSQLEKMEYGDILVYADSGSEINLSGYPFFDKKMEELKTLSILAYGYTYLRQFCDPRILADFGISEDDAREIPAAQAGQLYIRKTTDAMRIIGEWRDYMLANPEKIRMDFDPKCDLDGFVQNRCDGSVLGCIMWRNRDTCRIVRPNYSWMVDPQKLGPLEVRCSECDILPTRKKFDYKPYVMFVVGQELPFFERRYDDYTHFINIGSSELHRCRDISGDSIHHLKDMAEQTGLYWIWKNVDLSNVDVIGFSTHRKPFMATNEQLYRLIKNGATVVANLYLQNREKTHLSVFSEDVYNDFIAVFAKHHPELVDDFRRHEKCGMFYPCNSFVMRVDDFYRMCEFVFPIALEFESGHRGSVGKTKDRIQHAVVPGLVGEDLVSFYMWRFLSEKMVNVPFIVYPKEEELFRAETLPVGMVFGVLGHEFYYQGAAPRHASVVLTPNQYVSDDRFYPKEYREAGFPNVIRTKSISLRRKTDADKR